MDEEFLNLFIHNKPNSFYNFTHLMPGRRLSMLYKFMTGNSISPKTMQVNIEVPGVGLFRVKDARYDEKDMSIHIVSGEKIDEPDFTPADNFTMEQWKVL